jgi:hypothetical protein
VQTEKTEITERVIKINHILATLRRTCIAQPDAPDWLAKLIDAPDNENKV